MLKKLKKERSIDKSIKYCTNKQSRVTAKSFTVVLCARVLHLCGPVCEIQRVGAADFVSLYKCNTAND